MPASSSGTSPTSRRTSISAVPTPWSATCAACSRRRGPMSPMSPGSASGSLAFPGMAVYMKATSLLSFESGCPDRPPLFLLSGHQLAFDLAERRYIKETGLEARISRIVEPVANDLGFALVRVKITPENGCTLQIMAEDENGRFTITDCETLSKDLSPILDVEDPIDREYHLEVSS